MWIIFALLAAVAAASLADMFVASAESDVEEAPAEEEAADSGDAGGLLREMDALLPVPEDAEDAEDTGQAGGADEDGVMAEEQTANDVAPAPPAYTLPGEDEDTGERIHSSDAYPPAVVPEPGVVTGTEGDDHLRGSGAGDTLVGGAGNDTLIGAGGNALLIAGSGDNHLIGGEGDDRLIGGSGNDTLEGGWGDDLLIAGGGDNLLFGGVGNDTLVGVAFDSEGRDVGGANILNGGAGDDLLIAGQGDLLHGGEGADRFALGDWLAGAAPATILDYSPMQDEIVLHYDPERLSPPEVSISFSTDDPGTAEIRLDGQIVAYVLNAEGLVAEDIALLSGLPGVALAAE